MSQEFKEVSRLWFDYDAVHAHARSLYEAIQAKTLGSVVLVALGRGGWIPARILAASFEENNIPVETVSVSARYRNLGLPSEDVVMMQSLDALSLQRVKDCVAQGYHLWLIDGPYLTGRAIAVVEAHISQIFARHRIVTDINLGVLEWVGFESCPDAAWRQQASRQPDGYGVHLQLASKPYIEYPWEYGTPPNNFESVQE